MDLDLELGRVMIAAEHSTVSLVVDSESVGSLAERCIRKNAVMSDIHVSSVLQKAESQCVCNLTCSG